LFLNFREVTKHQNITHKLIKPRFNRLTKNSTDSAPGVSILFYLCKSITNTFYQKLSKIVPYLNFCFLAKGGAGSRGQLSPVLSSGAFTGSTELGRILNLAVPTKFYEKFEDALKLGASGALHLINLSQSLEMPMLVPLLFILHLLSVFITFVFPDFTKIFLDKIIEHLLWLLFIIVGFNLSCLSNLPNSLIKILEWIFNTDKNTAPTFCQSLSAKSLPRKIIMLIKISKMNNSVAFKKWLN